MPTSCLTSDHDFSLDHEQSLNSLAWFMRSGLSGVPTCKAAFLFISIPVLLVSQYAFFPFQNFAWANSLSFHELPSLHSLISSITIQLKPWFIPSHIWTKFPFKVPQTTECMPLRDLFDIRSLLYLQRPAQMFGRTWSSIYPPDDIKTMCVCTFVYNSCVHMPVVVFCGCCDILPQSWWLKVNRISSLTALEARS